MATIAVRVKPRCPKPGVGSWKAGADGREELELRVAAAPVDGAANDAVIAVLAHALGISRSEVTITSGQASRHKRIALPFEEQELRRRLGGEAKGED